MEENDLPLLQLFTTLREAGLPIGIDEYQLVLQALQAGFGMTNPALKRLCQTLWVKSPDEKQLLEYHFQQLIDSRDEQSPPHNLTPSKQRNIASTLIHYISPKSILKLSLPLILALLASWRFIQKTISTTHIIQAFLALAIILAVTSSNKQQTQKNLSNIPITTTPLLKPTIIATQIATLIPTPTQTQPPKTNKTQPNQIWILPLIALGGGYVIFRWVIKRKERKQKPTFLDEVQVAQAVQQTTRIEKALPENRFILIGEYFPVTERQMKQIWRYLRRPVRQGAPTVLDIEATVHQIGRQGILLKPVLVPRRVNQAELLLLIDRDGSMVPFGELSHRLAETALRGGLLGKAGIYYFHNCPMEYLYHDSNLLEAELVLDVVTKACSQRTAVLILSDAGAARGGNSEERYELTQQFLSHIKQRVRYIAWLNPLPRKRWLLRMLILMIGQI